MTIAFYVLLGIVWLVAGLATLGFLAYLYPDHWGKLNTGPDLPAQAAVAVVFWPVAWLVLVVFLLSYLTIDIVAYAVLRRQKRDLDKASH